MDVNWGPRFSYLVFALFSSTNILNQDAFTWEAKLSLCTPSLEILYVDVKNPKGFWGRNSCPKIVHAKK